MPKNEHHSYEKNYKKEPKCIQRTVVTEKHHFIIGSQIISNNIFPKVPGPS